MPGQRVGLMGGSFNPPHEGHVAIAEAALRHLKLDRVWWLVTPGNPLKTHDGLPSLADRVAACRRLVRDRRIAVTGFEAGLGSAYTAATLAYLRTRHPGVRFVWIMGADNLASFHRWRAWRSIMSAVPVAVMDRPGWRFRGLASYTAKAYERCRLPENAARTLATRKPPAWTFLTVKLSASSSTALRAKHRGAASSGLSQGS